jgi:hypothetical protein
MKCNPIKVVQYDNFSVCNYYQSINRFFSLAEGVNMMLGIAQRLLPQQKHPPPPRPVDQVASGATGGPI